MRTRHTPGRLYYHKTDGGAEYLCAKPVQGTDEGDLRFAVVRLDGKPELLGAYPAAPDLRKALRQLDAWFASGVRVDGKPATIAHSWVTAALAKAERC